MSPAAFLSIRLTFQALTLAKIMPEEDAGFMCNSDLALTLPLFNQFAFPSPLFSNEDYTGACQITILCSSSILLGEAKNLNLDKQGTVILQVIISSSISDPKHKQHLNHRLWYTKASGSWGLWTHIFLMELSSSSLTPTSSLRFRQSHYSFKIHLWLDMRHCPKKPKKPHWKITIWSVIINTARSISTNTKGWKYPWGYSFHN